jgi:hypothetical protein
MDSHASPSRPRAGNPGFPELPILSEMENEEMADESPRVVLLTGAAGNVGSKLRAAWRDRYELLTLDCRPDPDDPDLIVADLAEWDEEWTALLDEVDVIVHLAANSDPSASWPELWRSNVDTVSNLLLAAAQAGVERVVFASSCHVFDGESWPESSPAGSPQELPEPTAASAYGASKLMGERLGLSFARAAGLTFIGLRIGWVQPGENRPETLADHPHRGLWLSNADLIQLATLAVETDLPEGTFLTVTGVSRNEGSPWSWREAAASLGFEPDQGLAPTGPASC